MWLAHKPVHIMTPISHGEPNPIHPTSTLAPSQWPRDPTLALGLGTIKKEGLKLGYPSINMMLRFEYVKSNF